MIEHMIVFKGEIFRNLSIRIL